MNIDKVVSEAMQAVFGEAQYTVLPDANVLSRLPSSEATFPGGGHYQIELVGPDSPETLMRLLDMAEREKVRVHRVVGTLGGLQDIPDQKIRSMVSIEHERNFELIATPIMPLTNVEGVPEGKHPSEGSFFGIHLRGVETVRQYLTQLVRGSRLGIRHFLIWDHAALQGVQHLREHGLIPADITLKASIFSGSGHAVDVHNWMWSNDYRYLPMCRFVRTPVTAANPVPLTVAGFAEIRKNTPADVALDIHITTLESMGGLNRIAEAHEIIRVASPVNIKIERGSRVSAMMNEAELFNDVLPNVIEGAKKFLAHMKNHPELRMVEK